MIEAIKESLKLNTVDVSAEAIARELLENELLLEQLVFIPEGIFRRGYEMDVSRVEQFFVDNESENIALYLNREGLFDTLPEGLFYQTQPRKSDENESKDLVDKQLEESKRIRAAMDAARLFFKPFDHESLTALTQLELIEHEAFSSVINIRARICDLFWPEMIDRLNKKQKGKLLTIMLSAHQIAGQLDEIERVMTDFLATSVTVQPMSTNVLLTDKQNFAKLGEARLGVNSVVYKEQISNYAFIQIEVGPIPYQHSFSYLQGNAGWQVVNFIAELVFPLEIDWVIKTIIQKKERGFELSRIKRTSALGVTTLL